ncbi:MAG: iron ABC transporter permease [Burkholderiales bacterium]|jgi:iron complex transport system permease protein|nr:iron ABC transporter permease [Burkholderiales bacterium]
MPDAATSPSALSRQRRAWIVLSALAALALAVLLLALLTGSVKITLSELWTGWRGGNDTALAIIRDLRLPRALAAFACGGLLALAGAMMQLLLRNPLADPYVLGVSGGAAVGALLSWLIVMPWLQTPLAVFGALLSALLVWFGARRRNDVAQEIEAAQGTAPRLLLTGVVVAAGWGALIVLLLSLAPDAQLRSALTWLMGDLSGAAMPWTAWIVLALTLALIWPQARNLNQLAFGSIHAEALGVPLKRTQAWLYGLAALATAAAVVTAGCLSFVGLIVPHALRLLFGNDQRVLLPACVLGGGAFLTLADTAARTWVAPQVLPTGVLTALIGVPVFLFLLRRA